VPRSTALSIASTKLRTAGQQSTSSTTANTPNAPARRNVTRWGEAQASSDRSGRAKTSGKPRKSQWGRTADQGVRLRLGR
jgi:hypothetical protein